MATAVTMPRLGLNMVEGTVTEWKAVPGAPITKGQVIAVIESEKAEAEVEAAASGVLRAVYVEVGETVPIGALLGAIGAAEEEFDAASFARDFVPETAGAPAMARGGETVAPASGSSRAAAQTGDDSGIKAAPAARALARRLGVDLASVRGSGPGGRILPEDVAAAASGGGPGSACQVSGMGPAVLLLSGFAVDASGWRRQVEDLVADHTILTCDYRGIGAAPPLRAATINIGDLADEVAEALASRESGPVTVVGASMGAAVAIELGLRHPGRVRGLVLVTPVFLPDPRLEAVLRSWTEPDDATSEVRIRGMLPWLLSRSFLADVGKREAAASALRSIATRTPPATLRRHLAALSDWLAATRSDAVLKLAAPALILAAAEDLLAPLEHARALAGKLPQAGLEVLSDVGHGVLIERPKELSERIRRFVAS